MDFTPLQKKIIAAFKETSLVKNFYLSGGTLLATRYLNHRKSYDLDFFTSHAFTFADVEKEVKQIVAKNQLVVVEVKHVADRWEWELKDKTESTKFELVWYDFKPLRRRRLWQGIMVDSIEDATANKMMAMIERHEPKDIFDIYYILKKTGWTVARLLRLLKQKFGLPITEQTFFGEAEIALKRLGVLRGMLLTNDVKKQDKLFTDIHAFFDRQARHFLHRRLK